MPQHKCAGRNSNQEFDRFQILSIDGGGVKGLFAAAILAYIEEDLKTDVTTHFDLIVGTSTGGIIAIGLGLGMRPKALTEFYVAKSPEIFPHKFICKSHETAYHFWKRKYDNSPLKRALQGCYGQRLLGHSRKRLVIPSFNMKDDDIYLLKTAHHKSFTRDYKVQAWKAALATCAAPTFLPCFRGIDNLRLIDGGIWANNPVMIGLSEAIGILGIDPDVISILSLGTTDEVCQRPESLNEGGLWQWKDQAVKVLMRGQSLGAISQAQLILGKERVLRIDPVVPEGLFKMDKPSAEDHIGRAAHQSRKFMPQIESLFLDHKASGFVPFYTVPMEQETTVKEDPLYES